MDLFYAFSREYYQLSFKTTMDVSEWDLEPTGLEPATFRLRT